MNLCYSRIPDGTKELWYRDFTEAELSEHRPDLYTTLHPYNARVILSFMHRNQSVAACSDLAIEDALTSQDPAQMYTAMVALHGSETRAGFRYLTQLDMLHLTLQLQWQQPHFRFSLPYFRELLDLGIVDRHPLTPYARFLGLDPTYCVICAAMWVDPQRWDVVSGNAALTDTLLEQALGLFGPSPAMYQHLKQCRHMDVLNNMQYDYRLRSWLLINACWSSELSNALHDSGSRLGWLYQAVGRDLEKRQGRTDFHRSREIAMTQVVADYLLAHHRAIVTRESTGYFAEGWLSLEAYPDLASAYTHHFSNLQFK